jgi:hypothetical protein
MPRVIDAELKARFTAWQFWSVEEASHNTV